VRSEIDQQMPHVRRDPGTFDRWMVREKRGALRPENGMPDMLKNRCQFGHGGISDKNQEKDEANIFDEAKFEADNRIGIVVWRVVFK
jgi:hypothetical protein